MSRQAPDASSDSGGVVVDGLEFARLGRRLAGRMPVRGLPRLTDQLADDGGDIEWELRGTQDKEGKSFLELSVSGRLKLRCQRCLEGVDEVLAVRGRLLLVEPGQAWPDEELAEDGFDAVEAGKEMALAPMVEEEVLLALPLAPMHDACEPPVPSRKEHEPSPFAVLAKLKKGV
jgi:uncharacterized protein